MSKKKKFKKYFISGTFYPDILAKEIFKGNELLFKPSDGFYQYEKIGVWQKIEQEVIEKMAIQRLGIDARKSRVADVVKLVSLKAYITESLNNNKRMINVKNGMLDLKDFKLLQHDKKYLSSIQLNIKYEPDSPCPLWLAFLNEVLDNNEHLVNIIQEFFGYCLVADTRFEKMLFLVGDGANGKSTLISILIELLGRENISTVSLTKLDDQFHRAFLNGKLINISTECEIKEILESGYMKSIISGDLIDGCHKFKMPFSFSPFTRIIVAANELPRVRDRSFGFFRRLLIIPFNKKFTGQDADKKLKKKLLEDMDGIFAWSLEGLKRLFDQDDFTESETANEMVEQYRVANNPAETFIKEHCKITTDGEVEKAELYKKYREYSESNGFRSLNNVHFSRELKRLIPNIQETRPFKGKRVWVGLRSLEVWESNVN